MAIGNPIGQTRFISSPITRTEDSPLWRHARPRGSMDRPVHEPAPPTDEQRASQAAFLNHDTARAGAARRGVVPAISLEQHNAARIAAQAAAVGPGAAIDQAGENALASEVIRLHAVSEDQRHIIEQQSAAIEELRSRLDSLDGNAYAGDAS